MLECEDCGTTMWVLEPRDLLALVPTEDRLEVRQLIRRYGGRRGCVAFVCPKCRRAGLSDDVA